jgi:16S rRNA (cytosine1402-N4)-methyltransferase
VLLEPIIRLLAPVAGETYVDATAGLGGHARAIGAALGPRGLVVLNDVDPGNLERAAAHVVGLGASAPRVRTIRGNFANLPRTLGEENLRADLVLADLGFASSQMDDPVRGFSFMREGPLDMRLDPGLPISAADLVNSMSERELADLIAEYGEDRMASRIARKLVQARAQSPITTTSRLAELVRAAYGPASRGLSIDPATKTFQAVRIAVNDELGTLDAFLAKLRRGAERVGEASGWLRPAARVGIISFHSLEDRPVKRAFAELVRSGLAVDLTPDPVTADEAEVGANPRSRSAKLRVVRLAGT